MFLQNWCKNLLDIREPRVVVFPKTDRITVYRYTNLVGAGGIYGPAALVKIKASVFPGQVAKIKHPLRLSFDIVNDILILNFQNASR